MDRPLLRTRNVSDSRTSHGRGSASNGARRPHFGRRSETGRHSQKWVADQVAECLENRSEGEIAKVVECPKDTAQNWKLGRRAPNAAYFITMAREIDEIGMFLAEEADLGRFYGHDERIKKILIQKAMQESAEGQFARALLREVEQT